MTGASKSATSGPTYPQASLYIGDLKPEVEESALFEKFSRMGTVLSVRVCRDAVTKSSLGYGYINFATAAEALRALDELNFEPLKGKPMRLMWSQRDPALRRTGNGNIFIKNLDKNVDNKALFDTFSAFGKILSAKVSTTSDGKSRGFAFVHFEKAESAKEAIEQVNGKLISGKPVYVCTFKSRSNRAAELGEEFPRFLNVYVKNLGPDVTEEWIREQVAECGNIVSLYLPTKGEGEAEKKAGYAIIGFENSDAAHKAVDILKGKELVEGKKIYAGRAQKKEERAAELRHRFDARKREFIKKRCGLNLYIKNLEETITEERLREEFSKFGTVTSAKIMTDVNGRHRGFGFISYASVEEATKAVAEMNGHTMESKPLYVALHQRKEERQAQLATHYAQFGGYGGTRNAGAGPPHKDHHPHNTGVPYSAPPYSGPPAHALSPYNQAANAAMNSYYMASNTGAPAFVPNARGASGPAAGRWGNQYRGYYPNYGAGAANTRSRNSYSQAQPTATRLFQNGYGGPLDARWNAAAASSSGAYHMQYQEAARNRPAETHYAHSLPAPDAAPRTHKDETYAGVLNPNSAPDEKQVLGEQLYPLVAGMVEEGNVGKVTGMLLEMPNDDIVKLLHQHSKLTSKVHEAMAVLHESGVRA